MHSHVLRFAVALALVTLPAAAQSGDRCEGPGASIADDGSYEGAFRCSDNSSCTMVHELTPPATPGTLTKVCTCFRSSGADDLDFQTVVYAADGPGSSPGTLLGSKPATITTVPSAGEYVATNCTDLDLTVSGPVYVGANWNSNANPDFFLCSDQSPTTTPNDGFVSGNGTNWTVMTALDADFKAFGVRAQWTSDGSPTACVTTATTLCLSGRFLVTVNWEDFEHRTGTGHAANLTDDSGTFWFFTPTNVEMLVKSVDACSLPDFQNYWFFAAATTNVEYDIHVTDTWAGVTKPYHNELGVASPAIVDTVGFDTCDATP